MADITFLSAPIGGGKSLFATRIILEELRRSDRMVITNVPLRLTREKDNQLTVAEWCHLYVKDPVDVSSRLVLLDADKVKTFYRWYPGLRQRGSDGLAWCWEPGTEPWELPWMPEVDKAGKQHIPDLEARKQHQVSGALPNGALIVIDEVHLYFSAREWTEHGVGIEKYMSQLRKLNDDLILVTQHPEKVDKNFRRNATEWIYLKNFSRQKLVGGVTLPGRFKWNSYPNMPIRGETPMSSGWTKLADRDYHKCYDTMSGVGLTSGLNPEGSRVKGRHWSIWVVGIIVVTMLAWAIPHYLFRGLVGGVHKFGLASKVGESMSGSSPVSSKGSPQGEKIFPLPPLSLPARATPPIGLPSSVLNLPPEDLNAAVDHVGPPRWSRDVFIDGITSEGNLVTVYLSDDSQWQLGDGHCQAVKKGLALIDNVWYRELSTRERLRVESRTQNSQGPSLDSPDLLRRKR